MTSDEENEKKQVERDAARSFDRISKIALIIYMISQASDNNSVSASEAFRRAEAFVAEFKKRAPRGSELEVLE